MKPKKIILGTILGALFCCFAARAQGQDERLLETPPVPPMLIQFEYWLQQFVQWPAPTFPVWSIEISQFSDGKEKKPLYDVVLEDRKTHQRTHYLSDPALVPKIHEGEIYVTKINAKKTSDDPLTMEFSFVNHQNQPIFWRFVQGSDVSDRGSGLTQIARQDRRPLMMMYREQGAVAGQGTALQVGQEVSEAEVWKEISAPPYFIAYRGALTVGSDIAVFLYGDVDWHVDQRATALAVGQKWKLSSKERWSGNTEEHGGVLEITKISGNSYTLRFRTDSFAACEVTAEATPDGWRVLSLAHGNADHVFTIELKPGIMLSSGTATDQTFEIRMGRNKKVAEGMIMASRNDAQTELQWHFRSPNWAKLRRISQKFNSGPGTLHIEETIDVDQRPKTSLLSPVPQFAR